MADFIFSPIVLDVNSSLTAPGAKRSLRPFSFCLMNYPTVPRYLTELEVAALRAGDHADVDSGLGGSFSVRFEEHEGENFVFKNVSPDFEDFGEFCYTFDEVRQRVYQLVIDPCYAREVELITGKTYAGVLALQSEKNRQYWFAKEEGSR